MRAFICIRLCGLVGLMSCRFQYFAQLGDVHRNLLMLRIKHTDTRIPSSIPLIVHTMLALHIQVNYWEL
jgi:hypothetical protein